MKKTTLLFYIFLFLSLNSSSYAYWVWSPEQGRFVKPEGEALDESQELYDYAMQFYKERNLDEAIERLEDLLKRYRASAVAAEAQYRLGTIYEEKSDFVKAFQAYQALVESYPQSERINEVIEREFRIGNLFLSGKKGKLLGLEVLPSLPQAEKVFKHIVDNAPFSAYGDKAQFRLAITYKKMGKFTDAINAFQAVLEQYPQSELIPEARFQLAETSFQRSASQFRDQRALDQAAMQVDQFLVRYPGVESSEQAAKLRQKIDEKNAEKNYRVGLYYEKTNYLNSALIYYEDVAFRYPHTKWGQKSSEKLQALKAPATYLSAETERVNSEMELVEAQLKGMTEDKDTLEIDQLNRKLERLEQKARGIEKSKTDSINRRKSDIKRREGELKEKFKKLEKKEKLLLKNPSGDLEKALSRWRASLESERASLVEEKRMLSDWRSQLGVKDTSISLEFLPFLGEGPSSVERIRAVDAKKYYKLAEAKRDLLEEKEVLYKQHGEVAALLKDIEIARSAFEKQEKQFDKLVSQTDDQLTERQNAIKQLKGEIERLEEELDKKSSDYEEYYGSGWVKWLKKPADIVTASTAAVVRPIGKSIEFLNPFDSEENFEDLEIEELLERQMHLKEKVAAQRNLIDTLNQAFDSELALKEQKRLLTVLESDEEIDEREMRKQIKQVEKTIRSHYEDIKDRHARKRELLDQLDVIVNKRYAEGGEGVLQKAVAPITGFAKLSKAFIVGLPHEDVELTKSVEAIPKSDSESAVAISLKNELEKESLIIAAKHHEVDALQKELEILKARASLGGGMKFRSSMVKLPYTFIREAVESSMRLIPTSDREEKLVSIIDKESQELERYQAELKQILTAIESQTGRGPLSKVKKEVVLTSLTETPASGEETAGKINTVPGAPDEEQLKAEMQSIAGKIDAAKRTLENEQAILDVQDRVITKEMNQKDYEKLLGAEEKSIGKKEKKLWDELEEIQQQLQDIISKENSIEVEESEILEKRIEKIQGMLEKGSTKASVQDLLVEKERMQDRMEQLSLRRDFLSKEIQRFKMAQNSETSRPLTLSN